MSESISSASRGAAAARAHTSVVKDQTTGVPIMLAQAVILAATLTFCEIFCSPLTATFRPAVFALVPWAGVASLFAVMFSFVVGFALLWCAESFAYRMRRRLQPLVYATIGAISFGVWTVWVILGVRNMITGRLGAGVLSSHDTTIAVVSGALLGMAAFFAAYTLGERLARHRKALIAIALAVLLIACYGGYVLFIMLHAL
ncbi:cadmium transporter [Bifidobacterium anseris]|uniref:Cadmium transporter n=2 Tax=Bifidobacterium TaxID=1678 RepID=A0A2N5J1M4_9BIFI|nr:cadmium transporter [Bifidobacterium anseris]